MAGKRGLGRGLDALIPNRISEDEQYQGEKKAGETVSDKDSVQYMRISLVEPNREQPRKYFDEDAIAELADSIKKFGIIQPLLVQKNGSYYEIIAGERRWRAAKKAGLKEIPVIVRDYTTREAVEISLIENIQREDLNPIEEAKAYERLCKDFELSQEQVAERVSKSRSAVANSMRLLKLDEEIRQYITEGRISEGHARALLGIEPEAERKKLAKQIIENQLSVRETERIAKRLKKPAKMKKRVDREREALLRDISERLKNSLGTKVMIHENGKHKGKIEIEFYSDDELDRIYSLLASVRKGV